MHISCIMSLKTISRYSTSTAQIHPSSPFPLILPYPTHMLYYTPQAHTCYNLQIFLQGVLTYVRHVTAPLAPHRRSSHSHPCAAHFIQLVLSFDHHPPKISPRHTNSHHLHPSSQSAPRLTKRCR